MVRMINTKTGAASVYRNGAYQAYSPGNKKRGRRASKGSKKAMAKSFGKELTCQPK